MSAPAGPNGPPAPAGGAGGGWQRRYWSHPSVVAYESDPPVLSRGERSAVRAALPDGLDGRRVLDLGCGAGRISAPLSRAGADVAGLDVSAPMLRAARARFPELRLLQGDAAALPLAAASVDLVVCAGNVLDCLHPKARRRRAYREVARVLRPGGRLILSHHSLPALAFGWYNSLRPWKLRFRLRQILAGRLGLPECYIAASEQPDVPPLLTYYAWPRTVVGELERDGFELLSTHANSPTLAAVQRAFGSDALTRAADPWPYYVFARRGIRGHRGGPDARSTEPA